MTEELIKHVSDTALWTAACRALETERPDALFRDPLATKLAGDRGHETARAMPDSAATIWSVAIRTRIIDEYLREAVSAGIDTILNLGAGFDTRPYRMDLPSSLRWVEVDYSNIIERKEDRLSRETPTCRVKRIGLGLADRGARQLLFDRIGETSSRTLVLTEGVVPYLSLADAAALAADLRSQPTFALWVTEYFSPALLRHLQRRRSMGTALLLFDPPDWERFFAENGWHLKEMRYLGEESLRLGRQIPMPLFVRLLHPVMSKASRRQMLRTTGYAVLEPVP